MAGILAGVMKSSGADGLNLRIHLPGLAPSDIREQIAGLVSDVLPRLRSELKAPSV
jgi:hypothetical protein